MKIKTGLKLVGGLGIWATALVAAYVGGKTVGECIVDIVDNINSEKKA